MSDKTSLSREAFPASCAPCGAETSSGAKRRAESPLGRIATPQEIAAAVLFLASPEATIASGSVLDLNGASYLRM